MEDWKAEAINLASKWWAWFCYVLLGLLAKFSYDLVKGKKITFVQAIGTAGISLFVGFLASIWCMKNSPENGALIVPIVTLSADKITTLIFTMDIKNILSEWLKYWANKLK